MEKGGILFLKVREDLAKRISQGEFPIGSQLPTEMDLMKAYDVSITTIRKAVQTLADEGAVEKRQGMGTFVTGYPGGAKVPSLDASRTLNIAAFLPDTTRLTREGDNRHWALNLRRLNGICAAAARHRCQLLVHGLNDAVDLSKLDGAVIIASYAYTMEAEDSRKKLAADLESNGIPFVTVSEFDPRFASRLWVAEMTETEFYKGTCGLLERGFERIALIGPGLEWSNPRYAGYRKALAAKGVPFEDSLVIDNPSSDERSGAETCGRLLDHLKQFDLAMPDAIFCTTDLQAYGVLSCLQERGLKVPEDISVLGVDNLAESASLPLPLSSMEFSGPELGEAAIELLLDAKLGKLPGGRMLSCPGRIIWRSSVSERKSNSIGNI